MSAPRSERCTFRGAAFASLCVALALAGCNVPEAVRDLTHQPSTAYDRYARALESAGLAKNALGRDWLVASDSALRTPFDVALPFHEVGFYNRAEVRAVAYRVKLTDGQRFTATVRPEGLPLQLFVDLFEQTADTAHRFEHVATADTAPAAAGAPTAPTGAVGGSPLTLSHEARHTATYILRIQPELLRDGRFEVSLGVGPSLAFPVQGGGNRAVQSYFGASRDGGRREHHGIDIFAPRGTPALAATDGYVRSISPNELGGNVVWLSDGQRGQVLYYAHLDRHHVVPGQQVRVGDTLGFVGNTGNARTTKPHLHFGIYRRGVGPVDPYPFVRLVTDRAAPLAADTTRLGSLGIAGDARVVLRAAPSAQADTVRRVPRRTEVEVVGATGRWYRVELPDGVAGYVPASSIARAPAAARGVAASASPAARESTPE